MKTWKMCLIIFSVIVVYNSSKYYEAWTNYELEKLEIQRKADKDKYNALLKTASSPVFQKYDRKGLSNSHGYNQNTVRGLENEV